jgi:DNA-directed RNA polymerase subunit H
MSSKSRKSNRINKLESASVPEQTNKEEVVVRKRIPRPVAKPEPPVAKPEPEPPVAKPEPEPPVAKPEPASVEQPLEEKKQDVKKPEDTKSSAQAASPFQARYPAMNDNFVFIDNLYRSRLTLLDILRDRGYDVSKYERFSPAEATAAASAFTGLSFHTTKKNDPKKECHVRYENISQQKMKNGYFSELVSDEDCENVEIIVMMSVHVTDTHHAIALREYMRLKEEPNEAGVRERRKLRVSFFSIDMMVINPMRHVLVPKHELVPEAEHKELLERMYVTSKSKLPEIKFHMDPIARCIGAVPGDIVKITRPSAAAGEAIIYRVCAP